MTLVRLLALDSLSRGLEYENSSRRLVKTNGGCEVKMWRTWQIDVLVWTQLPGSWWSLLSPYWRSLAHIGPCWLWMTCVTPVSLSTLDVGANTCSSPPHLRWVLLQLIKTFFSRQAGCLTFWVGASFKLWESKVSVFDRFPTHWWFICSYPVFHILVC